MGLTVSPSGGGGAGVSDPGVAWFSSAGNTSTGNGTPGNPYGPGNGQKAFDAGFRSFRIGPNCDIGNLSISGSPAYISFIGSGPDCGMISSGLSLQAGWANNIYLDNCLVSSIACSVGSGQSPAAISLRLSPTAFVSTIDLHGADGEDDGQGTPADGGTGGNITIYGGGQVQNALNVSGGNPVNGGTGGAAGAVFVGGAYIAGTFYPNSYP